MNQAVDHSVASTLRAGERVFFRSSFSRGGAEISIIRPDGPGGVVEKTAPMGHQPQIQDVLTIAAVMNICLESSGLELVFVGAFHAEGEVDSAATQDPVNHGHLKIGAPYDLREIQFVARQKQA